MFNHTGLARLDFIVHLDAPLRIDGDGVDIRRDAAGNPCIPATALKGRLRIEARQLCYALAWPTCDLSGRPCQPGDTSICPLCTLFGARGIAGSVFFTDCVADADPVLTYSSRGRHESILALPNGSQCLGTIRHRIPDSDTRHSALLMTALLAVDRLGTHTAIGWGRCQILIASPPIDPVAIRSALWDL